MEPPPSLAALEALPPLRQDLASVLATLHGRQLRPEELRVEIAHLSALIQRLRAGLTRAERVRAKVA